MVASGLGRYIYSMSTPYDILPLIPVLISFEYCRSNGGGLLGVLVSAVQLARFIGIVGP